MQYTPSPNHPEWTGPLTECTLGEYFAHICLRMYAHLAGHPQLNIVNATAFSPHHETRLYFESSWKYHVLWGFWLLSTHFAANALLYLFKIRNFHFFLNLWLRLPFRCSGSFTAEPLAHKIQPVYPRDAPGFLKWPFAVMQLVFCTLQQRQWFHQSSNGPVRTGSVQVQSSPVRVNFGPGSDQSPILLDQDWTGLDWCGSVQRYVQG
jgi:hypothetical protein